MALIADTRTELTTELTAIRGESSAGGNTKGRIADAIEGAFQSSAKLFRVTRTNATEDVAPTATEVPDAHVNFFSEVLLTDGKLEFWSHNGTTWSKNWVRADGGNAIAPAWAGTTAVIQNEVVTFENRLWKSNSARTTGASFNASEQTNWTLLDHQIIKAWPASTAVYSGEVVVQSSQLYRSNSSRTTGSTWTTSEQTNWTLLSVTTLTAPDWAGSTAVVANELRVQAGRLWRSNSARTTGTDFTTIEEGNWTDLSSGYNTLLDWTASTAVLANEIRKYGNVVYRSNYARTTNTAFDVYELGNWTLLARTETEVLDWSASTSVLMNELRMHNGAVIRSDSTRTTGASFDATEAGTWTRVVGNTVIDWAAATLVYQYEVRAQSTSLYRSDSTRVTGASFDSTEQANWTQVGVTQPVAVAWAASTAVVTGQIIFQSNSLYVSESNRTTGSSFDVTEQGHWQAVTTAAP